MRLELQIQDDIWLVRVDPQQLENAVLNLAINGRDAIDAIPDARPAVLTIALANRTLDATGAAQHGLAAGDYVCLSVTDSGAGMSEAVASRAVEPFFSTKSDGQGTGLGLPMVYGFAHQSGGAFKIASVPGRGTSVSLLLARIDPTPAAAAPAAATTAAAGPVLRQRVLVAEDDQPVRTTTAELLSGLGHEVLQAGTAAEALTLLDHRTSVLMTDLGLPDMDGRDLASRALTANPDLAVIIASGKPQPASQDDPRIVWLGKPYSAGRLAAAISRATGATD